MIRSTDRILIIAALATVCLENPIIQTAHANDNSTNAAIQAASAQSDARMEWWRDAKFGMFIHWGIYAIPARGEWVQWNEQIPVKEYARFADQFHPTNFSADFWAETARSAGMKYMVLTARHHDGFALFDDPGNPFTSVSTAAHHDFIADYTAAVRKAGLRVGLYYSPLDWRFPGFFFPDLHLDNAELMREQYHRQMKELMSNYGKIDVLWFDGGESDWLSFHHDMSTPSFPTRKKDEHYQGRFSWRGEEVNRMMRELQPQIIVNNRATGVPPDYTSREGFVGNFDNEHPWETCSTLAGSWGYAGDADPMSLKDLVQMLVNVVGRGGNLLMNIGPRPDGSVVASQVQRLHEAGEWLATNGESIYSTRGGPFLPGHYGVSTCRSNLVYLHILKWPGVKLLLPAIPATIKSATALSGGEVSFRQTESSTEISLAKVEQSDLDTIVALELNRSATDIPPLVANTTPSASDASRPNLAQGKKASADSEEDGHPAENGNDGNDDTRWCAADGDGNHWWKVDLGANYRLSDSEIKWEMREDGTVYNYKIEVSQDDKTWTVAVDKSHNTSVDQAQKDGFDVVGRYVRITVLDISNEQWASFYEFILHGSSTIKS